MTNRVTTYSVSEAASPEARLENRRRALELAAGITNRDNVVELARQLAAYLNDEADAPTIPPLVGNEMRRLVVEYTGDPFDLKQACGDVSDVTKGLSWVRLAGEADDDGPFARALVTIAARALLALGVTCG